MNHHILQTDVQDFISKNLTSKVTEIVLKGSPFSTVSVQELANQLVGKQKSSQKLPTWFHTKAIYYPPKISIEQTSSEKTAAYKAELFSGELMIDITGGFGIDAYYFSKHFKQVIHCEINRELSQIVNHNYKQLQVSNITTIANDGLGYLKSTATQFDCIYIDPSRRHDRKGKVFLLKDCVPNVPDNLDFLFSKSDLIVVKNSPILDITATIHELKYVQSIHIIAVNNEVKELLFVLQKGNAAPINVNTVNFTKKETQTFNFIYSSEATPTYSLPLAYLYEPNSAILKSGSFNAVATQLNVFKIAQHSHLYTTNTPIPFPGRTFHVEAIMPYDKKKLLKQLPQKKANITTRNFPKSVEQIRKETKIKDGGDHYLFFTKDKDHKNIVILCTQLFKS